MQRMTTTLIAAVWLAATMGAASAETTLRIGLAEDPDILDPTLGRTFVGRIVFASLCDKLFDITPDLKVKPQLATGYQWTNDNKALVITLRSGVMFQDGEPMNAAAVKYSLERHLGFPGSTRKSEISAIQGIDVVDDHTVRLNLATPFAPLVAQLTDRAGMIVSPKAAEALKDKFGTQPVCAGPYKFVERVAQDRIVLQKFDKYWDRDKIHIDKIVFQPIPDNSVRLANLQSGGLDFIERVPPTDVAAIRSDKNLKEASIVELGYQGITINLDNGPRSKNPLGQDARVRQAFELALDRGVISQVVYNGEWLPGNQWVPPTSPYYVKSLPVPKRDVAKAKQLLKDAGLSSLTVEMMIPNSPDQLQVGQVIQAMEQEAGITVNLRATEFASSLDLAHKGDYQAWFIGWSGRTDPDGNIYTFIACNAPLNDGHYCNPEVDKELNAARTVDDQAERSRHYAKVAESALRDLPIIYVYHRKWIYAHAAKLTGFEPYPDGLVRPQGLAFK